MYYNNAYITISEERSVKSSPDPPPYQPYIDFFIDQFFFVILFLLFFFWQKKVKPSLSKMSDDIFLTKEVDEEIGAVLTRILYVSNAARVVYGQFHNGTYWSSGTSMLKMSAYLEKRQKGVSTVMSKVKDVSVSLLYKEIDLMQSVEKQYVFKDINETEIEVGCKNHLEEIGVEACYEFLVCYKKQVYGILAVQYIRNYQYKKLNQEQFNEIKDSVDSIGYKIEQIKSKRKDSILKQLLSFTKLK